MPGISSNPVSKSSQANIQFGKGRYKMEAL